MEDVGQHCVFGERRIFLVIVVIPVIIVLRIFVSIIFLIAFVISYTVLLCIQCYPVL